jgi:hypothetical protein
VRPSVRVGMADAAVAVDVAFDQLVGGG